MKLEAGKTYNFSSANRTIQVNVPNGSTATLSTKLLDASQPHSQDYTENQLVSGFLGHCIVTVSGENCEFVVQPDSGISEV